MSDLYLLATIGEYDFVQTGEVCDRLVKQADKLFRAMEQIDDLGDRISFLFDQIEQAPAAIGVYPIGPPEADGMQTYGFHFIKGVAVMQADALGEDAGVEMLAVPCIALEHAKALAAQFGDVLH